MRLTSNFKLSEFVISQVAARHGIPMVPPDFVVANLQHLCETYLEPLRFLIGRPLYVSSGYRPPAVNCLVGGAMTRESLAYLADHDNRHVRRRALERIEEGDYGVRDSGHTLGYCADVWSTTLSARKLTEQAATLPGYDQVIYEFGSWCHIGMAPDTRPAREQILTITTGGTFPGIV